MLRIERAVLEVMSQYLKIIPKEKKESEHPKHGINVFLQYTNNLNIQLLLAISVEGIAHEFPVYSFFKRINMLVALFAKRIELADE